MPLKSFSKRNLGGKSIRAYKKTKIPIYIDLIFSTQKLILNTVQRHTLPIFGSIRLWIISPTCVFFSIFQTPTSSKCIARRTQSLPILLYSSHCKAISWNILNTFYSNWRSLRSQNVYVFIWIVYWFIGRMKRIVNIVRFSKQWCTIVIQMRIVDWKVLQDLLNTMWNWFWCTRNLPDKNRRVKVSWGITLKSNHQVSPQANTNETIIRRTWKTGWFWSTHFKRNISFNIKYKILKF